MTYNKTTITTMVLVICIFAITCLVSTAHAACPASGDVTSTSPWHICSTAFPLATTNGDLETALTDLITPMTAFNELDCETYAPCPESCPVTLREICIAWDDVTFFTQVDCPIPSGWVSVDASVTPVILAPEQCTVYSIDGIADADAYSTIAEVETWCANKCLSGDFTIRAVCSTPGNADWDYNTGSGAAPTGCPTFDPSVTSAECVAALACGQYGCGPVSTFDFTDAVLSDFDCGNDYCTSEDARFAKCIRYSINSVADYPSTYTLTTGAWNDCNGAGLPPACFGSFCTDTEANLATPLDSSIVETCGQYSDPDFCKVAGNACQAPEPRFASCYHYSPQDDIWDIAAKDKCADLDTITEPATETDVYTFDTQDCTKPTTSCRDVYLYATATVTTGDVVADSDPQFGSLTPLIIKDWAGVSNAKADIGPMDVSCTGYTFKYKVAKVATVFTGVDQEIELQWISFGVDTSEVVSNLPTQCINLCQYSDIIHEPIKCRTAYTECPSCSTPTDFTTTCSTPIVAMTAAENITCPTAPSNVCLCNVVCDVKTEGGLAFALYDPVIDTTVESCKTDSFRPSASYCFGSPIESAAVRDVFCIFTDESGDDFFAGSDCDGVSALEAVKFTPNSSECEFEYLCGDDELNLEPCTCPAATPAEGAASCDTAGLSTSATLSCSVTWDNGNDPSVQFDATPADCCALAGSTPGTTAGSDCGCPCISYEWQCLCSPDGFDGTELVICDCEQPNLTDPAICLVGTTEQTNSACTILPVTVRCVEIGADSTATAKPDAQCALIETKPTITTYTCPPNSTFDLGSVKCPEEEIVCYNDNKTISDAYDCETCVDATGAATGRVIDCSYVFTDLSTEVSTTSIQTMDCPASFDHFKSCVTEPVPDGTSFVRGKAVTYTWSYIGPTPSADEFQFQPRDYLAIDGFTFAYEQTNIKALHSAKTIAFTPSTVIPTPFNTVLNSVIEGVVVENAATPIQVTTCPSGDTICVTNLCTLDGTTCLNGGSCVIDPTTTFTKCQCPTGTSGDQCQFDSTCTGEKVCYDNGFPQFGQSCNVCTCDGQWSGDKCNTCTAESINQLCSANRFIPSKSSASCACECFYGYAGATCQTRVVYATLTVNIPPAAWMTPNVNWEKELDGEQLPPYQSTYLTFVAKRLQTLTQIASLVPIEYRTTGSTSSTTYVVRFTYSGTALAQWQTFLTSLSAFQMSQQTVSTAVTASAATVAYDPLCGGSSCTSGSPYSTRQSFIDCTSDSSNAVCKTTFGTLSGEIPDTKPQETKKKSKTGLIVGLVVGLTCGIALIVVLIILFLRCRKNSEGESFSSSSSSSQSRKSSKASSAQTTTNANDPFPFQLEDSPAPPKAPKAPKAPQQGGAAAAPTAPKAPKAPKQRERDTELTTTPHAHKSSGARKMDDDALPFPWKQCTDHLGNIYYLNMHTMESSFNKP